MKIMQKKHAQDLGEEDEEHAEKDLRHRRVLDRLGRGQVSLGEVSQRALEHRQQVAVLADGVLYQTAREADEGDAGHDDHEREPSV
jgi:hypothetical protein